MAFEELLQLLSKTEAVDAKQDEVMRLFMLATAEMLLSGELTPGDPEWKAIALGLKVLAKAAGSVETFTRMAAEFAATPGGEAVAEAHRRMAVSAVALEARAEEYVAFMRGIGALADSGSDSDSDSTTHLGGLPRGGPGGPTPDTLARNGPTDGSSPAASVSMYAMGLDSANNSSKSTYP